MPADPRTNVRRTLAQVGISLFILLNVAASIAMNRPDDVAVWLFRKVNATFSPRMAAMLQRVPDDLYRFAHFAGYNVKWQMYSYLQRYDFTILAVGIDASGRAVLLPEPLQSARTPFEQFVTDFRETKYQLNIYQYPSGQPFYASYLLRKYPDLNGVPTRAIRLDLQYRYYVDRSADALASGQYFKGPEGVMPMYPPPVPRGAR